MLRILSRKMSTPKPRVILILATHLSPKMMRTQEREKKNQPRKKKRRRRVTVARTRPPGKMPTVKNNKSVVIWKERKRSSRSKSTFPWMTTSLDLLI